MIKSVVGVAAIVGYNHCHTPRHSAKGALDVSLGYISPRGFHILPALICYSNGWFVPGHSLCEYEHAFSIGDRSGEQTGQRNNPN
ncbi:hypothetical protein TNCV_14991 [Trichonephila clavipes]|nr:hypothetical protein TNCV_14991 [Trichonephila clavipes]